MGDNNVLYNPLIHTSNMQYSIVYKEKITLPSEIRENKEPNNRLAWWIFRESKDSIELTILVTPKIIRELPDACQKIASITGVPFSRIKGEILEILPPEVRKEIY